MEPFKEQILNFRAFEFGTTIKVLGAYPEEKLDLKPAEKSRTARELVQTFIREEYVCRGAMRGDLGLADHLRHIPDSLQEMLEILKQIHQEVQGMITQASEQELNKVIDFYGHKIRAIDALMAELHDQIHHRGQFSVYLRLAGAKVPSIYGPTADEPAVG